MLLFVPAGQIRYIATDGVKCKKGDKKNRFQGIKLDGCSIHHIHTTI